MRPGVFSLQSGVERSWPSLQPNSNHIQLFKMTICSFFRWTIKQCLNRYTFQSGVIFFLIEQRESEWCSASTSGGPWCNSCGIFSFSNFIFILRLFWPSCCLSLSTCSSSPQVEETCVWYICLMKAQWAGVCVLVWRPSPQAPSEHCGPPGTWTQRPPPPCWERVWENWTWSRGRWCSGWGECWRRRRESVHL